MKKIIIITCSVFTLNIAFAQPGGGGGQPGGGPPPGNGAGAPIDSASGLMLLGTAVYAWQQLKNQGPEQEGKDA